MIEAYLKRYAILTTSGCPNNSGGYHNYIYYESGTPCSKETGERCEYCGAISSASITTQPHVAGPKEYTNGGPTCTSGDSWFIYCTNCSSIHSTGFDEALEHIWVTSGGYTKCSRCGESYQPGIAD